MLGTAVPATPTEPTAVPVPAPAPTPTTGAIPGAAPVSTAEQAPTNIESFPSLTAEHVRRRPSLLQPVRRWS